MDSSSLRANGVYAPTPLTDETEAFGLSNIDAVEASSQSMRWMVARRQPAREARSSWVDRLIVPSSPSADRADNPRGRERLPARQRRRTLRTQGIDVYARYRAASASLHGHLLVHRRDTAGDRGTLRDRFRSRHDAAIRTVPLNPRHAVNFDWAYEREHDKVVGVAVHFIGSQVLTDSTFGAGKSVRHDRRAVREADRLGERPSFFAKDLTGVHQLQFFPCC